jgi:hypothetical protein
MNVTMKIATDDELLAEVLRQPLPYQSRDDVGRAGRPEGHNHAHRSVRIGLRPRYARYNRQRGRARGQM